MLIIEHRAVTHTPPEAKQNQLIEKSRQVSEYNTHFRFLIKQEKAANGHHFKCFNEKSLI